MIYGWRFRSRAKTGWILCWPELGRRGRRAVAPSSAHVRLTVVGPPEVSIMDRKQQIACAPRRSPAAHARAAGPARRRAADHAVRPAHGPPVWDYAPHRRVRGALARPAALGIAADGRGADGHVPTPSKPRAWCAAAASCWTARAAATWARCGSGRWRPGGGDLDGGDRCCATFVYDLVLQHEHQHDETILQTAAAHARPVPDPLRSCPACRPLPRRRGHGGRARGLYVVAAAATSRTTTSTRATRSSWRRSRSTATRSPMAHLEFIADGGYEREELWAATGGSWRFIFGVQAPEYWRREASAG